MKKTLILLIGLTALCAPEAQASTYGQRVVAAVLMGEARGEGETGMAAVAEVIRNRAKASGRTPLAVVLERKAFSCLNGVGPDKLYQRYARHRQFSVALALARKCYQAPHLLPNRTKGATFYDQKTNRPWWIGHMRRVAVIGNHSFYVLR